MACVSQHRTSAGSHTDPVRRHHARATHGGRHRLSLVWPAIAREIERPTGQGHPARNILPQSKVRTTLHTWTLHAAPQDRFTLDNPIYRTSMAVPKTFGYCWRTHTTRILASEVVAINQRFRMTLNHLPTVSIRFWDSAITKHSKSSVNGHNRWHSFQHNRCHLCVHLGCTLS